MKPFILHYAENIFVDEESVQLEYSEELSLNVLPETNEPAINLTTSNLETFTKSGHEPTDFNSSGKHSIVDGSTFTRSTEKTDSFNIKHVLPQLEGETRTFTKNEATDRSSNISRIAKQMSSATLTEAREATDIK